MALPAAHGQAVGRAGAAEQGSQWLQVEIARWASRDSAKVSGAGQYGEPDMSFRDILLLI